MTLMAELLDNNRAWAAKLQSVASAMITGADLSQPPECPWIECSDSRVAAHELVGLATGTLLVYPNIANLAPAFDASVQSVLQYAVQQLQIQHIVVCGHYDCAFVRNALRSEPGQPLDNWLAPIRVLYRAHQDSLNAMPNEELRHRRLCELNVLAQVTAVRETSVCKKPANNAPAVSVYGLIYDITDITNGLLTNLD